MKKNMTLENKRQQEIIGRYNSLKDQGFILIEECLHPCETLERLLQNRFGIDTEFVLLPNYAGFTYRIYGKPLIEANTF